MGAQGAQVVVDVGVQLKVLQSSIAELQKSLSGISVDSSTFKKAAAEIEKMTKAMQSFQSQTSKAFTSQQQFNKAESSLDKIEESLIKVQQIISNVKFSELKLDSSQLEIFKQLKTELEQAEAAYTNFQNALKQQAIANFDLKSLGINASEVKGSLDEIKSVVESHITVVKNSITSLNSDIEALKTKLENLKSLNESLTNKTNSTGIPEQYNKFLKKNSKTGEYDGFKGGKVSGRQQFIDQVINDYQLGKEDIEKLKTLTFNQIKQMFQEIANSAGEAVPNNMLSGAADRVNEEIDKVKDKISTAETTAEGLSDLKVNIEATMNDEGATEKLQELGNEAQNAGDKVKSFETNAQSAAAAPQALTSSSSTLTSALQGLVDQLNQSNVAFTQMQQKVQTLQGIKQAIVNFTGFHSILNLVKSAIKEAASTIKELDSTMNAISIVTNMSTSDLWKQADAYSQMAQNYGVSISGAYQVSKIYYQQGLQTNEVLTLTNETLKLCKVSGLDYATSTDYMTTALRGFKMEMSEASTVVDVYSSLASTTAVSQGELAEAMSKTASSLESVGTSFQEASSMIATMVAVTRESATNIGTALKSIASRYGELTKSTDELTTDADGQVVSFNKVDKALQSVGITIQTTDGQFRSFTDVITELSGKWDQLSSTQQRYIATQMAGNRQQSRFLALVSNGQMLQQNLNTANNSEGIGTAQALKAMDSLESKLAQLKTAYQQFYVTMGAENVWKAAVSGLTSFTNSLNALPKLFGTIPVTAITIIYNGATLVSSLLLKLVSKLGATLGSSIKTEMSRIGGETKEEVKAQTEQIVQEVQNTITNKVDLSTIFNTDSISANEISSKLTEIVSGLNFEFNPDGTVKTDNFKVDIDAVKNEIQTKLGEAVNTDALNKAFETIQDPQGLVNFFQSLGVVIPGATQAVNSFSDKLLAAEGTISGVGKALQILSQLFNDGTRTGQILSSAVLGVGAALAGLIPILKVLKGQATTNVYIAAATAILTVITSISSIIDAVENKTKYLEKEAEQLKNTMTQIKADEKTLQSGYEKYKQLEAARYESAEAAQEYQTQVDNLADSFPELVSGFDSAGNAIITLENLEDALKTAREKTAQATVDALEKENELLQSRLNDAKKNAKNTNNSVSGDVKQSINSNLPTFYDTNTGSVYDATDGIYSYLYNVFFAIDSSLVEESNSLEDLKEQILALDPNDYNDSERELIQKVQDYLNSPASIVENFMNNFNSYDFTTTEGQEAFNKFVTAWHSADESITNLRETLSDDAVEAIESLITEVDTIISSDNKLSQSGGTLSSAYLQLKFAYNNMYTWIGEQANNALMLSNYINQSFENQKEYKTLKDYYENAADQAVKEFNEAFTGLSQETQEWLNSIDSTKYTAEQIKQILVNKGEFKRTEDIPDILSNAIDATYSTGEEAFNRVKTNFESATKAINNLKIDNKKNTGLDGAIKAFNTYKTAVVDMFDDDKYTNLSGEAANFINTQSDQIKKLISQGMYTQAENLSSLMTQLVNLIFNSNLDLDSQTELVNILKTANLNTIEGINAAIKAIKASDKIDQSAVNDLITELETRMKNIQENVIISYEASLDNVLSIIETDEKVVSKITSGMSMSEVQTLIAKANSLGLTDWNIGDEIVQQGDKFIVTAENVKTFFAEYKASISKNLDDANTAYTNLYNDLNNIGLSDLDLSSISTTAEKLYNLYNAGNTKVKELFERYGIEIQHDGTDIATIETTLKQVKEAKSNAEAALNSAVDVMTQTALWALGEYSDVWHNAEGKFDYKGMDIALTSSIDELDVTTRAAVKKIQSGLSTLLSDYISKMGQIDWSDYENSGIESNLLAEMKQRAQDSNTSFEEFINTYVVLTGKTESEINSMLISARDIQNKASIVDALKSIITSYDNFTYEVAAKYASAIGITVTDLLNNANKYGISDNGLGGYQFDYDKLLATVRENASNMLQSEYNEMISQLNAAKQKASAKQSNAISTIIANRNKLTDENILALANSLETNYDAIFNELNLTLNSDGTSYSVDLSSLQTLIKNHKIEVTDEIEEIIAVLIDNSFSSISNLISNQSKGITSLETMQKTVNEINKLLGENANYDISDLYSYNAELKAYQLNHKGFMASLAAMKVQLDAADASEKKIIQQNINSQLQSLAENIDISGYINAIGTLDYSKIYSNFTKSIDNYNTAVEQLEGNTELAVYEIANALYLGGANAVKAAEAVAAAQGKTLTSDEISTIYKSAVTRLNITVEQVASSTGSIIDKAAADIINAHGGKATEIGNSGQYLVEAVSNLYFAYADLLQQMRETAGATTAEINAIAAKMLSSNMTGTGQFATTEQNVINALSNAANMTYAQFGELLANAGVELSQRLVDQLSEANVIKQLGGEKMAILDFSALAKIFDWDLNSDEYISAFKTYNDSLIGLNRKAENAIVSEINSLSSAKGGDWLNITQLWSTLQSKLENQVLNIIDAAGAPIQLTAFDLLKSKLEEYGATLDDGILKLDSDANIAGAITTLTNYAQEYGDLLQSDVASLADTLDNVLKSFASSIETALSGSLTKSGAVDLTNMVKSLGLDNVQLNFTETANGLKLSYQSAAQLCIELKKSNNEAGKLVFDKVYASLTSASEEFSTIQQTSMKIKDTQNQIEAIERQINESLSKQDGYDAERVANLQKQKSSLQDQLSLYDQIKKKQSASADSYNFMNNKTPSYLDGVTNYWNSVGTAFNSMNTAASSGKMSIQDFQNIINEMNSLAASTGKELKFMGQTLSGSSEDAANLINTGLKYLENVDGKGVQINLSKLGTELKVGTSNMQSGFKEGVQAMAKSQVELLDAAIQLLEVVVQMEALGDIDVDNDNTLDLNEIFNVEYDGTDENGNKLTAFNENYTKWAEQVMEASKTNTDLEAGLKSISINGHTMEEYIDAATGSIEEQSKKFEKLNISEQEYAAVMQAFYEAVQNGDYNLENISASVWETFEKIMPDGTTIKTPSRTIVISGQTHWSIDWTSENTQNLVSYVEKTLKTDEAGAKEAITQAVERTEKGEAKDITDVLYTLSVRENTKIKINKDGTITIGDKTYKQGTVDYIEAIQKEALRQAGISEKNIKSSTTKGNDKGEVIEAGQMTATLNYGKGTIYVTADDKGNLKYYSDGGTAYNSPSAAAEATVKEIIEHKYGNSYNGFSKEKQQEIYNTEYYARWKIAPKIETEVTDASGAGINSSNVASVRASAEKIANASIEEVQGWVDEALKTGGDNGDGTVTITVDNFSKTVSVENAASEFSSAANEIAGQIDTSLIGNIQTAIENAFAADSFINAISTAMTTGITQAFTAGEEGTSFSVPDLTLTPTSLTVDTTDITPKLDAASETPTIEISTLTLKPTGDITVDMTDKTPKLGDSETQTVDIPTVTLNVTGDVTINTGTNVPTLDKTEFTIPTAIKAVASILNLDLETASSTVINKTIQELPADQKLELAKALVTIISLSLDTTNSTLDPKSKSMEGLPNDQQLEAKEAVALIKKINPDTVEAVFGNLTYTIPEENKTFKVSDIFTALIQTINAETISGEGGTNITLPESIDVGGKTIPIAQALAIIQSVSAQLGQGVVPDYSSVIPEGDIEIHKNIVIVADNVSLDASNGGSVDLGTMNDKLIAQANQAGITADKVNTLNEKYNALADAMVNVEKTGGSEESLESLTSAVTEYGTALDNIKDSVTNFDMADDVASSVESTKTAIASTVEALGGSIPEGFATAVEAGKGEIDTAVSTAVQDVPQDINDVVDMNSPSHMAQEYGESIPEGFVLGVNNKAGEVDTAITNMVSNIPTEINTVINSTNWSGMGSQVSSDLASGLSSNQVSVASAAKSLVSAVTDNLDFSTVSTSIGNVDIKSIDKATYDKTLVVEDIKEGKANISNLTVGANAVTANKTLSSLQNMNFSSTSSSLSGVQGSLDKISGASFGNFDSLKDKLTTATTQAQSLWDVVQKFANQTFTVNLNQTGGTTNTTENKTTNETKNVTETKTVNTVSNTTVNVDTSSAQNSAKQLATTLSSTLGPAITLAKTKISILATEMGKIPSKATLVSTLAAAMASIPTGKAAQVSALATQMSKIPDVGNRISNIVSALKNVPSGSKSLSVQFRYTTSKAGATGNIGNFAQAKGSGKALASGYRSTLMGELGPELVVSNGRYFLVGQNGAEFVDLAKDAIVFNHKQTQRLMEQGAIGSRGRALTNETNAVSLAKGRKQPDEGFARVKTPTSYSDTGGSGGVKNNTGAQKTKAITETIRSVSVSPTQSEQIKLYSFAKGNMNGGPAMASAAAALAALKEIRAAWKALESATAKTLGSSAGKSSGSKSGSGSSGSGGSGSGSSGKGSSGKSSGSGGSGGSGGSSDSTKAAAQVKSVTEDIERWYNLERQIVELEKEITYQQALRNKYESDRIANGEKIYETYQKELRALEKEIVNQNELVRLQKSFYDARRAELASSEFKKIFTYDENGLQQYTSNKPGSNLGLDILEKLTQRDENGKLINNAVNAIAQLNYLKNTVGFDISKLLYKDDGTTIADHATAYQDIWVDKNGNVTNQKNADTTKTQEKRNTIAEEMMQVFWDQLEGWQTEMDSLWDSYNDTLKDIQENQTKQNEILQKLVDNELSIEQDIYKAVEARKQSDIDTLTEQKEAISKAASDFTDGLSEQLERERSMYEKNNQANELTKLQRQLAILQRSGGSASQIRSLQDQIDTQMQDEYFNKQQEQIDAIKEASDKQIEALESQIDIMTESLEFQKENGLLWAEVRDIMKLSTNEVMAKLLQWNPEYKEKSDLDLQETMRDFEERYQVWDSDRGLEASLKNYQSNTLESSILSNEDKDIVSQAYRAAYTRAIQNGSESPEIEANKAASDTMKGLGYHDMDTTTDAAVAKYQKSFENRGFNKEFEEQATDEYGQEYDTAYASTFAKAYKDTLTGSGEGQFGLEDISQATEEQRQAALDIAEMEAQKAVAEVTKKAYEKQGTEESRIKQDALNKEMQTGKYGAALRAVGQDVIDNSGEFNTNDVFEAKYQELRAQGKSIEEAAKEAAPEIQKLPDYANANQGAIANTNLSAAYTVRVKKKVKKKKKWVNETRYTTVPANNPITVTGIKNSGKTIRVNVNGYNIETSVGNVRDLTDLEKYNLPRFKQGGLIDFTGPAIVDGSKQNPESILSAEQTKFLREDLLGASKNSLSSIVAAMQNKFDNTFWNQIDNWRNDMDQLWGNYQTATIPNAGATSVQIGNVNLTFETGVIADDYDARRAGSNIADEIMKIARQYGNNSVSRR